MSDFYWFWLAQPHPFPETLIIAAPEAWFRAHTSREPRDDGFFQPEALADYLAAARNPETIRGMCEDYRAAATIDLEHDRASRAAGERIGCPLFVLSGSKGKIEAWYAALAIWRGYAAGEVTGGALATGHYLAEEAPRALLEKLDAFLGEQEEQPPILSVQSGIGQRLNHRELRRDAAPARRIRTAPNAANGPR